MNEANDTRLPRSFWEKVEVSSGCWMWTGPRLPQGYGVFRPPGGPTGRAHRVSYAALVGPIPDGMQVDHMCIVPACVNPQHLRLATNKENNENRAGARRGSRSGVRGLTWHPGSRKWQVRVHHHGRCHSGGYFTDIDEAEQAAIALRNHLYTHNLRDRLVAVNNKQLAKAIQPNEQHPIQ